MEGLLSTGPTFSSFILTKIIFRSQNVCHQKTLFIRNFFLTNKSYVIFLKTKNLFSSDFFSSSPFVFHHLFCTTNFCSSQIFVHHQMFCNFFSSKKYCIPYFLLTQLIFFFIATFLFIKKCYHNYCCITNIFWHKLFCKLVFQPNFVSHISGSHYLFFSSSQHVFFIKQKIHHNYFFIPHFFPPS